LIAWTQVTLMGPKLFNAVRLYIDGVRDGHLSAALDKYVVEDLIQRSAGIEAGRAGLSHHLAPYVSGYDQRFLRPMRGFEDGSSVFLHTFHCYGLRQVEQVSIDIFDTDADDHIIEQWNVTTALRSGSRSGCSQIDGPAYVTDLDATEANKALVRAYVDEVLIAGRTDRIAEYVSAETYAQHDPDIGAGLWGHLSYLAELAAAGTPMRYVGVDVLVGSGNFVAMAGRCEIGSRPYTIADLFRVDRNRIVEHWDTLTPVVL
jgi:predicted SnoaL-like aldol condensation-catalyzing enzyme